MKSRSLSSVIACFSALCTFPLWSDPFTGQVARKPVQWESRLLCEEAVSLVPMNESPYSRSAKGLRLEVQPGKTWSGALLDNVLIPRDAATARISISEISPDARCIIKLLGNFDGCPTEDTIVPFDPIDRAEISVTDLDARVAFHSGGLLRQLQICMEGNPGGYVVVDSLEFLAAKEPRATGFRKPLQKGQKSIPCVDLMPNLPEPFEMRDWRALAQAYDTFVFDPKAKGQYLPFIWFEDTRINIDRETFGLPSYAGSSGCGPDTNAQESVTCAGAVLGATIAGIDKTKQERDYVLMCEAWYNTKNGLNLYLNRISQESGDSFWYEIWPHVVLYALADRYRNTGSLESIMRTTADRWAEACGVLSAGGTVPNFDHTAFNFRTLQPVDNGRWKEPDAAAGVAWLEYMAWVRFQDPKYRDAAKGALDFLQGLGFNPYYEVLMPYGAYIAARANAELGTRYDVERFVKWCFGISNCRGGWGVMVGKWGGYDCDGLVGSVDNLGGYAFAMNTFAQAGALVPLVRYDARYARAIGKWMLNLANAARLFYPDALPATHQTSAFWTGDPQSLVAYEGLRCRWKGKSPCATGDPIAMKWGPLTDRGLYGSSYVGLLGGIVARTNEEKIPRLDCLATDFYAEKAYPTYLYFNPYPESREVEISVGSSPCSLYDAASHRFIKRNVSGVATFKLRGDHAAVIVVTPAGGKKSRNDNKLMIDDIVIDYAVGSL